MEDSQTTNSRGEWSSLGEMYMYEETEFMEELLGNYFASNVEADAKGFAWSCLEPETTTVASADEGGSSFFDSSLCYFQSLGCSSCVNVSSDVNTLPEEGAEIRGGSDRLKKDRDGGGDKEGDNKSAGKSKKRARSATPMKRNNVKSKKKQNVGLLSARDEDGINGSDHRADLSADHPDDQHNGSTSSSKDVPLPLVLDVANGKTRASRGSATDPQSLYARKRRERINERLRILQNLIPNGTKVDISTMLEEAVQYVKFLQLQIKLLSSDDLWMYAPIAYNGMDIGLDAAGLVRTRTCKLPMGLPRFEI